MGDIVFNLRSRKQLAVEFGKLGRAKMRAPLSRAYKATSTGNPRSSASLSNPQSLSVLPSTPKTLPEFALAAV
jgi:hypothetical protein